MIAWFKRFRAARRERRIFKQCGCICYCPGCGDPLNDQADTHESEGLVNYFCQKCGWWSQWDFDSFPVPVLRERP